MLAKTGIKVDLMHKFMPPGPFLVFWQQTCPIHYFRSKTNILGGLAPFHCCTGQIVKTGYRLHTRHSHYSKTFNKGIHTMSFVKRQIAKTSIGSIQGTSICLRNRFLFFCNEHAQSTTIGPKPMFWVVSRYFVDDPDLLRKLVSGCLWLNVLEQWDSWHTTWKISMHSFRTKTHILGSFHTILMF